MPFRSAFPFFRQASLTHALRVVVASVSLASITSQTFAQCDPVWESMAKVPGIDPGISGWVSAHAEWDPDGPGPLSTVLVLGGSFSKAGDTFAQNIVTWDGQRWSNSVFGPNQNLGPVDYMINYNGRLIISSRSSTPAKVWNGNSWESLGGIGGGYVRFFGTYGSKLVVIGSFNLPGAPSRDQVALWDGATWESIGSMPANPLQDFACAAELNGELYVGGPFSAINGVPFPGLAKWTGSSWTSVPTPVNGDTAWQLAVHDNQLFMGSTVVTGIYPAETTTYYVRRFNGTAWLGSRSSTRPFTIHTANGELYVTDPGLPVGTSNVLRFTGPSTGWAPVGTGISQVRSVAHFQGELLAMGSFTTTPSRVASGVARLHEGDWRPLSSGVIGAISDLQSFRDELFAAGSIASTLSSPAPGVLRYDGDNWTSFLPQDLPAPTRLAVHADALYIGGSPTTSGASIFRWDGTSLSQIGPAPGAAPVATGQSLYAIYPVGAGSQVAKLTDSGWTSVGAPFDSVVKTVHVHRGELFAAGNLWANSGASLHGVARWTGSAWVPTPGMGSYANPGNIFIRELHSWGNDLIAIGSIPGNTPAPRMVLWDGGSWRAALGTPPATYVINTLLDHQGGFFLGSSSPDVSYQTKLFDWDGTSTRALGTALVGTELSGSITSLEMLDGELVAAGSFGTMDGRFALGIARYHVLPCCGSPDFNGDGDLGTDADIEAFFKCLAGSCCQSCFPRGADFNADGDSGTDADIEAFFRVLAGGNC